jgi:hypothetical protein
MTPRAGDQTQTAAELQLEWHTDPRWAGISRDYTADEVIRLRGSFTEEYVPALGALTGNQAVQQVKAGLKAIYLSGWQVAGDANTSGQTYPDQSLYPFNSVPTVVRCINNALIRADQVERVEGEKPNQVSRLRPEVTVSAEDLIDIQSIGGDVTEAGVRSNVSVGIRYIESWLRGVGAAAIDNLMEDAATAEISRSQIWQWIHYGVVTREGLTITHTLVESLIREMLDGLERRPTDRFDDAITVFRQVALDGEKFPTFLTVGAYAQFLIDEPTEVLKPLSLVS